MDPAIAAAHAIYTADDRRRWVVEALLLAREPIESVAARTTLPVETIAAYAALFFDVAGRLEADDWLMTRVIGIQWLVGLSGASPGAFWRYLALTGGVRGLEFAIAITTGGPFPTWLRVHFRDDPQVEADYRLRGRLLFALMTAGTDQEVEAIVRLDEQRRHVDRPRSAGKREPKKKLDLMAAFIGPRKGRRRRVVDELLGSSATPKVAQAPSAIAHIDLASDYSRLIREPLESGGRS